MTESPEYFSRSRVEAFSDGVFAIIVTLLVLELKVPSLPAGEHLSAAALAAALVQLLPKYLSWVTSFFVVCVTWANHHRVLATYARVDAGIFWLNVHLLLWLSFIPFPTALLGDFYPNPIAICFYGLELGITMLAFTLLRFYALWHPDLLQPGINLAAYRRSAWGTVWFGLLPYLLGAALGWWWPLGAVLLYLLIPGYFVGRDETKELAQQRGEPAA